MIEIMNLWNDRPSLLYDIKVCRPSQIGNPFILTTEAQRDEVCDKYAEWFKVCSMDTNNSNHTGFKMELDRLITLYKKHKHLRLFCWCAPKRCHAETIKRYIEEKVEL